MTRNKYERLGLLVPLALGASLVLGCAAQNIEGYHPDDNVPENGAAEHKPTYMIRATIEPGELAATENREPVVFHGKPPTHPRTHPWADPTLDSVATGLDIDTNLAEACNLPKTKAFFAYDSDELEPEAKAALDALATCFKTGPLKGQSLVLTGHADPRGSAEYNIELGEARAESVATYLEGLGLASSRLEIASRGEGKAHDDPEMWNRDRKVVFQIADDNR